MSKVFEPGDLRAVIIHHLDNLQDDLSYLFQTTHASMFAHGDIKEVSMTLQESFENPSSFNVSELSQSINSFLRKIKAGEYIIKDKKEGG